MPRLRKAAAFAAAELVALHSSFENKRAGANLKVTIIVLDAVVNGLIRKFCQGTPLVFGGNL